MIYTPPTVQQQYVAPYTGKGPADSNYFMDVGKNGETSKVNEPANEIATNSLIVNAQNAASSG